MTRQDTIVAYTWLFYAALVFVFCVLSGRADRVFGRLGLFFELRLRRAREKFLAQVTESVRCKPIHCVMRTDRMDYPYDDYSECRCPVHCAKRAARTRQRRARARIWAIGPI